MDSAYISFASNKLISDGFIQLLVGVGLKPTPTSNYHYLSFMGSKTEMFFIRGKMIRLYLFPQVLKNMYQLAGLLYRNSFLMIIASSQDSTIESHVLTFPHSIINFPVYES